MRLALFTDPNIFYIDGVGRIIQVMPTLMFPRGVDVVQFSPAHRGESFKERYGIAGKIVLLYVGRLSLEAVRK